MTLEIIAHFTALFVALGTVVGLFFKLKAIDKNLAEMVNKKISAREKIKKDLEDQQKISDSNLQKKDEELINSKFKQLWAKIASIDTQVNGDTKYKVEGLVMTVEKMKIAIKNLGGDIDD